MSRNGISADQAFASLRDYSGRSGTKLADVAAAVIESHGCCFPVPRPKTPPANPTA